MNDLTTTTPQLSGYAMTIADVQNQVQLIQQVMTSVMKDGEHYGTIPGCGNKKSLLKSGAEKLSVTFRLAPEYVINKTELPGGHREYEIICKMIHIPTGAVIGHGVGSCSTMESKYRWRTGAKKCPKCGAEAIIKGKKEYGGGWVCLAGKGGCNAKYKDGDKEIESQAAKTENPDIADTYNTVLKMAKKRAQVDATLTCTGASDIFEQDLDEFSTEELERIQEERRDGGEGGKKPKTAPPKAKTAPAEKKEETGGGPTLEEFKAEADKFKADKDALASWWEERKDVALDALKERKFGMLNAYVVSLLGGHNA